MSHTPGPWKATGTKALGLSEVIAPDVDFDKGHLVAVVNRWYGSADVLPREQVESNARLIAAAPELLKACEHVLETLAIGGKTSGKTYTMLQKAIAKATGKSV